MANILHDLQSEDPQKDHSSDLSQDHSHDPSKDHVANKPHINRVSERSLTDLKDHDNSQDLMGREPKDHQFRTSHDLSSANSGDLKRLEQPIHRDSSVSDIAKDHDSSAQDLSNKDTQRDHELELPDDPDFEYQAN